jgi:hypothetical protein
MAESRSSSQKPRKKTASRSSNGSSPKAKSTSSRAKPATRSKPTARSKPATQSKPTARSRSKSGSKAASSRSGGSSSSGKQQNGAAAAVASRVGDTASSVKDTATKAAGKAAGPAIAVGAAAAGVAGGALLRSRMKRRKVMGIPMPRSLNGGLDAKSIAKTVGDASADFARTSKSVSRKLERAGNQAERIGRALGDDRKRDEDSRRSPVEVVLDGLTHRR